jgi:hypothetical protein
MIELIAIIVALIILLFHKTKDLKAWVFAVIGAIITWLCIYGALAFMYISLLRDK